MAKVEHLQLLNELASGGRPSHARPVKGGGGGEVALPGIEPGNAESKSGVLPITL